MSKSGDEVQAAEYIGQNHSLMAQLFEETDAKLCSEFTTTVSADVDKIVALMQLSTGLPISVIVSSDEVDAQPLGVRASFHVLVQMQRRFGEQHGQFKHNETQTDPLCNSRQDISTSTECLTPNSIDVGVECKILEPTLVTKSGRQVRSRYSDIYTDVESIEDDIIIQPKPTENLYLSAKNSSGRKRGRPRKYQSKDLNEERKESDSTEEIETLNLLQQDIVKPDDKETLSENINHETSTHQKQKTLNRTSIQQGRKYNNMYRLSQNQNRTDKIRQQKKDYEERTPFRFKCDLCSFHTKRESHFHRHMKYHNEKKCTIHECNKCDFKTIRLASLTTHLSEHNEKSEALKCSICDYTCLVEQTMINHHRLKHGGDSVVYHYCRLCDYYSHSQQLYKRHMQSHTVGEVTKETFQCDLCPYKTDKKGLYNQHKSSTHSNIRQFICDMCGTAFKRKHGMLQHKAYVHQKKSLQFRCSTCNKLFRSLAHLKEHNLRHSNEKKFLCHVCGSKFKTKSSQKRHYDGVHRNKRAYVCRKCNKSFHVRATLLCHQRLECKRKPRKDAFGLTQQSFINESNLQTGELPIKIQSVPSVSAFKLHDNNIVELHSIKEGSFIEFTEQVLVPETSILESQNTQVILQEGLSKLSSLQENKISDSYVVHATNQLPINSSLTQQLMLSSNTQQNAMANHDGLQQTVLTFVADGTQVQYLDNSHIMEHVQVNDAVGELGELSILAEESVQQGVLTESETHETEMKPVYYTTYACEKSQ